MLKKDGEVHEGDIMINLSQSQFLAIEADTFWCLSKLVDDIQDNYTEMQPGVHKQLNKMKAILE
jgi:hypothetical protein